MGKAFLASEGQFFVITLYGCTHSSYGDCSLNAIIEYVTLCTSLVLLNVIFATVDSKSHGMYFAIDAFHIELLLSNLAFFSSLAQCNVKCTRMHNETLDSQNAWSSRPLTEGGGVFFHLRQNLCVMLC